MLASLLVASGLFAAAHPRRAFPFPFQKRQVEVPEGPDWNAIEPSRDLVYTPCFDGDFKCARLLVPLDWSKNNGTGNDEDYSVAIAIVTYPALVPDTDPSFGGTVLYNPGGPGGAPANIAWVMGAGLQAMVDGDKHFEMLIFDPRGVGKSTPPGKCFEHVWQRQLYEFQKQTAGHIGSGPETFAVHYEYERVHGELCSQAGQDHINAHLGTASVARDMLHIVDKVDEERRRRNDKPPRTREEEKPKLQFFGSSYGSVLGSYFASMFPGRVGRMMVRSIFDAEEYRAGNWDVSMRDTEEAIDYVYEACWARSCPMRLPSDTSPADIKARVDAVIEALDTHSASILYNGQVHVVRSEELRSLILGFAYRPNLPGPQLAQEIARILAGNYTSLVSNLSPSDFSSPNTTANIPLVEVGALIRCLDIQKERPLSLAWARERYESMERQSPTAAPAWAILALRCTGFTLTPAYDFHGDFGSPPPNASDPNAPDAPILIIGSRVDPVTPLVGAWAMGRQHEGSSVIVSEVYGHDPSYPTNTCLSDVVRAYFAYGVVPANGTVCTPDTALKGDAEEEDVLDMMPMMMF